jgi:sterol desaturase/sphingolipid hydroxylase (fatty acid hydroxylase superfamily)
MFPLGLFSLVPESFYAGVGSAIKGGTMLSIATVLLTLVLELVSLPTTRSLLKQRDGTSLYLQAIFLNFLNHFAFGVPVYATAVPLFCTSEQAENWTTFASRTGTIFVVHSILYYSVHKAFHTSPKLYVYHRFHHRFNTHVPPVAANAVSAVEYLAAYVIPFAVAAALVHPHETELQFGVAVVSVCNLLIHTPRLEEWSKTLGPAFVTTHGHLEHHRRMTINFAAPTINVDWIVEQLQIAFQKKVTWEQHM